MTNRKINILVVDDEQEMLTGFASILSALGYKSSLFSNPKLALEELKLREFDLIFCDYQMPEIDGLEFIKESLMIAPTTPIIIFTAYGTVERAVQAMKIGAFDFLEKPINTDILQIVIEKGIKHSGLLKEKNNLLNQLSTKFSFDNIIGKSERIEKVFEMIENISNSDANILITGESGTGKELIARSIHAHSSRKDKPFVPVNCGAFPENLFEAELFGFEKGAFTGADSKKIGLLESANGGTFFLDEVCELNPSLQVKLLRVLQERKLRRLGGIDLIDVDFRIISATNRNIEDLLKSNQLRSDFYYRINVININLPPLRERKDDINLLAEYFLKKSSEKIKKSIIGFSEDVKIILENYQWPGNVRELENVIERAVTLTNSNRITINDLPEKLRPLKVGSDFEYNRDLTLAELKLQITANIEKRYLISLLEKHKGNVTKIAEEAGMTRRNIHRLLKIYEIDAEKFRH